MIRHLIRRLCRLTYRDIFERSYGSPTDVDEVWRHREMLQDARRPKRHLFVSGPLTLEKLEGLMAPGKPLKIRLPDDWRKTEGRRA